MSLDLLAALASLRLYLTRLRRRLTARATRGAHAMTADAHDHDPGNALADRAAEHIATLPAEQRDRAREAMTRGEVYVRRHGHRFEVRVGKGDDAVTVYVHRASLGPRPNHAGDN